MNGLTKRKRQNKNTEFERNRELFSGYFFLKLVKIIKTARKKYENPKRGCPRGGVLPPGGRRSKLRLKFFLNFGPWTPESSNFAVRFGF